MLLVKLVHLERVMRSIEKCSRNFIDSLRSPERHRPFDISDESTWLSGAIVASQGQGNPQGSRLTLPDKLKTEINRHLKRWRLMVVDEGLFGYHQFEKITAESFDSMHSLVEVADPECLLLFGRVQKIHNIWLKYQIALYYSGSAPRYTNANPGFDKLLQLAHVPIDNVVLKYLSNNQLAPDSITHIGASILDWKLRLQKSRYLTLQDILRQAALTNGYTSPLHFEMDLIWAT